jgi:tetratricopeptide (TPR) repeat protein
MKKRVVLFALIAIIAALWVPPAWSQMGTVKGTVKDQSGNPMAGITVEYRNVETGRKMALKTDNKGEYSSLGVPLGTYRVTFSKDGQTIFFFDKVPVRAGEENVVDLDLAKERAAAPAKGQISPEQKKQAEAVEKENLKIRALNQKLAEANAAQQAGNFDQAIAILSEATQADPTRDLLWARLGEAYRFAASKAPDRAAATEKYKQAVEPFKKAVALKPNDGTYHNALGEVYAKGGMSQEAIAEYNTAAQVDPPHAATYYFNEGAVLTNTGKTEEANAAFDKAIAADPTKAEAYYQKGVNLLAKATLTKEGKMVAPPEATASLNKYLEIAPDGPNAQAAKELLTSMGATIETSFGKSKKTTKK